MNPTEQAALEALQPFLDQGSAAVLLAAAVFTRIAAIVFLLPGLGEGVVNVKVKLAAAISLAMIAWPLLPEEARVAGFALSPSAGSLGYALMAEAIAGLTLGLSLRFLMFALQTAGTLAAQSLSISQMFGTGVAPDPEPTIASLLTIGAIAMAMTLGLHVKAVGLIAVSYDILPLGDFPSGPDLAEWSAARAAGAFSLAVSLALPFLVISFGYNLALGFINRAMPQMMVSFVGLPAITWAGLMLLLVVIGGVLTVWTDKLDDVFLAPLALKP